MNKVIWILLALLCFAMGIEYLKEFKESLEED